MTLNLACRRLEWFDGNSTRDLDGSTFTTMDLSRNAICALRNLRVFANLRVLVLAHNKIAELPVLPPNVVELDVSHNLLARNWDATCELHTLTALHTLDVSACELRELPHAPSSVRVLKARSNLLISLRGLCSKISTLDVSNNPIGIRGLVSLPQSLRHLTLTLELPWPDARREISRLVPRLELLNGRRVTTDSELHPSVGGFQPSIENDAADEALEIEALRRRLRIAELGLANETKHKDALRQRVGVLRRSRKALEQRRLEIVHDIEVASADRSQWIERRVHMAEALKEADLRFEQERRSRR